MWWRSGSSPPRCVNLVGSHHLGAALLIILHAFAILVQALPFSIFEAYDGGYYDWAFSSGFKSALLAASFLSTPALAQDDGRDDASDKAVVVYGSGIDSNAAVTGLDLTPRETPQSLTIITREQLDDQAASTIADVLEYTTGLSVKRVNRGRNLLSGHGTHFPSSSRYNA